MLPPFPKLAEEYLATFNAPDLADQTRKTTRSVLKLLVAALPAKPTSAEVRRHWAQRIERGELLPSTANKQRDVLRKVFSRMCAEYGVPSPMRDLAPFKVAVRAPKALTPDARTGERETTYLRIRAAVEAANPLWAAFCDVQRYAGLRVGEALALEPRHVAGGAVWCQVEQQRDRKTARAGPPKHGSTRTLKLAEPASEALRYAVAVHGQHGRASAVAGYLFPFYGDQLARMEAIMRAVAPDEFPRHVQGEQGGEMWHVFRHTFASDLLDEGFRVEDIWQVLGHKDPRWTFDYCARLRGRPVAVDLAKASLGRAERARRKSKATIPGASQVASAPESGTTIPGSERAGPKSARATTSKVVSIQAHLQRRGPRGGR